MTRSIFLSLLFVAPLYIASAQQDPQDTKPAATGKPETMQPAPAQQGAKAPAMQAKSEMQTKPAKLKDFVDKNNDGIDDRRQGANGTGGNGDMKGQRKRMRMRDTFIDADGDGINDNRCSGTGLQRRACQGAKGCGK